MAFLYSGLDRYKVLRCGIFAGTKRMEYRREIDGLRTLAVLPVILFHAGFASFSGGFVGVDIFFVISGYLITSIILDAKQDGAWSLADFYERRARRILPALFFIMASCIPFAWILLLPGDFHDFAKSIIATLFFSSNFLFWNESGYFGAEAELRPLLHTWSLAVEEQFYLFFPLLVGIVWRYGYRGLYITLLGLGALSLTASYWLTNHSPMAAFYLLPARVWELLIGSICALYLRNNGQVSFNHYMRQYGSIFGLMLLLIAIVLFDKETSFPGLFAVVPTVGAALIIVYATPETLVGRLLSTRALVGIGLISYSAYLWHQPLFAFARHQGAMDPSPLLMAALSLLSLIAAYFTWRFVETPFRSRNRIPRQLLYSGTAFASLAFLSFALATNLTDGFANYGRIRQTHLLEQHTRYDLYDFMQDDGECRFWDKTLTGATVDRFVQCAAKHGKAVLVIGDSHAMNLFNVIAKSNAYPFVVGISQGYCRVAGGESKACSYEEITSFIKKYKNNLNVVVYHQTGNPLLVNQSGEFKIKQKYSGEQRLYVNYDGIQAINAYLDYLSTFADIIWIGPWTEPQLKKKDVLSKTATINELSAAYFLRLDTEIKTASAGHRYSYLSLVDAFAEDGPQLWTGNCLKYRDLNHLSRCGEDFIADNHRGLWRKVVRTER